jgi:hypothetical protein
MMAKACRCLRLMANAHTTSAVGIPRMQGEDSRSSRARSYYVSAAITISMTTIFAGRHVDDSGASDGERPSIWRTMLDIGRLPAVQSYAIQTMASLACIGFRLCINSQTKCLQEHVAMMACL